MNTLASKSFTRRLLATLLLSACCAFAAAPALADAKDSPPGEWTLGERDQWRILQKEVDQYAALVNESCKTTIAVTFDHESFRGKLMEPGKTGMAGSPFSTHMTQSLTTVREVCLKSDDGKKAVKSKISKIVLQHAGGSRAHKLEKGQLTTVLDPAARPREWQGQFAEFLKRSL